MFRLAAPAGKHLRTLEFPEKPANVTFGGKDRRTLFVTARSSVYTMPMEATGHRFGAVDGHVELGLRHRSGVGASLSHLQALRRFERAIAVGSRDAVFWRALLLIQSETLDGDREEAKRAWHALRHEGHRDAVVIGYVEEILERPSPGGGFYFVEKFAKPWAEAGDADAQLAYGYYLLLHGKDEEGAFGWWRKAAKTWPDS